MRWLSRYNSTATVKVAMEDQLALFSVANVPRNPTLDHKVQIREGTRAHEQVCSAQYLSIGGLNGLTYQIFWCNEIARAIRCLFPKPLVRAYEVD